MAVGAAATIGTQDMRLDGYGVVAYFLVPLAYIPLGRGRRHSWGSRQHRRIAAGQKMTCGQLPLLWSDTVAQQSQGG